MKTYQNAQNVLGQLSRAALFTAVIAMAQPAEAESLSPNDWLVPVRAFPVPEEQQTQAIQEFYTTHTDLAVLEQAMQVSGLPLNQLEITTVLPMTWPDGC